MAEQQKRPKLTREERLALMAPEIRDVEGAATLLAVSSSTIYSLARQGKIPATRVGREWRFSRTNLIRWVANGSQADQVAALLTKGKVAKLGR
jgi:excisionase family DNA binding protein